MLWQPMHIAALRSPAAASPAGCCAAACAQALEPKPAPISRATAGAISFLMVREREFRSTADYRVPPYTALTPPSRTPHEVQRHRELRRHRRPDAGGERRDHAEAPAAGQGRTGHRQDDAGRGSGAV